MLTGLGNCNVGGEDADRFGEIFSANAIATSNDARISAANCHRYIMIGKPP